MDDPTSVTTEIKALHGLKFEDLIVVYSQFCKNEDVKDSPIDIGAVIHFYDEAMQDLPDAARLKALRTAGPGGVLDGKGERFADLSESNRRIGVSLQDIPLYVQKAFVAAEDKRFESHHGIDERGVIRAFIGNLASRGRPQGGSTITQQVVKNLSVGDDVTYERKIREMIVASRLERILTKPQILGLYLNGIYLGRGAYGIEMAAESYFGKPVARPPSPKAALLAGMPKGPNFYSPDKYPDRARERRRLRARPHQGRRHDHGAETIAAAKADLPHMMPIERRERDSGFYVVDFLTREARTFAGVDSLTSRSPRSRSDDPPGLQRAVEEALQDGLANTRSRDRPGRLSPTAAADRPRPRRADPRRRPTPPAGGPISAPRRLKAEQARRRRPGSRPGFWRWQARAVLSLRCPLAHGGGAGDRPRRAEVGPRMAVAASIPACAARLQPYDVVRVKLGPGKGGLRAQIRVRPAVQGAALVMDNQTGGILAMAGGFSYPAEPAQPGHPDAAAARLHAEAAHLPRRPECRTPAQYAGDGRAGHAAADRRQRARRDSWSPKNYEGGGSGPTTLRRGLEFSKNLVTARLLQGGIAPKAPASLKRVCDIALEAQIYAECEPYYPFVLGAQPVRMLDLAGFYAAVANEGARPAPYALESVERDGKPLYTHAAREPARIGSADRIAFYQLKTMLQGVTQHGTAAALSKVSAYVAGKTGTSENENDAWFAGLTNEITVVVWVGYDNADGSRKTLGRGQTGGHVSVPIAAAILQAAWANDVPKTPLGAPPPRRARSSPTWPSTRAAACGSRAAASWSISAPAATGAWPTRNTAWYRARRSGRARGGGGVADSIVRRRLLRRWRRRRLHLSARRWQLLGGRLAAAGDGSRAWLRPVRGLAEQYALPQRRAAALIYEAAMLPARRVPRMAIPIVSGAGTREYAIRIARKDRLSYENALRCRQLAGRRVGSRSWARRRIARRSFRSQEGPRLPGVRPGAAAPPRTIVFTRPSQRRARRPRSPALISFADWGAPAPAGEELLSAVSLLRGADGAERTKLPGKMRKRRLYVYVAEARFAIPQPASRSTSRSSIDARGARAARSVDQAQGHHAGRRHPEQGPEIAANRIRIARGAKGRACSASNRATSSRAGCPWASCWSTRSARAASRSPTSWISKASCGSFRRPRSSRWRYPRRPASMPRWPGAIEQNIFYVNQMMQFGKFLAVLQPTRPTRRSRSPPPSSRSPSTATCSRRRRSSRTFRCCATSCRPRCSPATARSTPATRSARGLPKYSRNRIRTIAALLEKE